MSEPTKPSGDSLLRRWSRLKTEARGKEKVADPAKSSGTEAAIREVSGPAGAVETPDAQLPGAGTNAAVAAGDDSLPPVESLTIDSNFSAFMQPKVDEALKRRALKQLFRDPHFNVMDGLDVYIDDYSKPDPISPEIVRQMVQGRYIFNPPPTRINALGNVEDIPEEELAAMERDANDPALEHAADPGAVAISGLPPAEADAAEGSSPPSGNVAGAAAPLATGDAASAAADASGESVEATDPHTKDTAAR